MNELKVFTNKEFGEIRTITRGSEPWFVASDICKVLDIQNVTQAVQKLDEDERSMFNIGRQGNANCVNEYGLYNLVLSSRKNEAKDFKRWITHEILPSIRRHGMYAKDELLDNPDLLISVAQELKAEKERNKTLAADNERMKPKEIFADAVATSHNSILIGELAKILRQNGIDTGEKRLFAWLRQQGYLIRRRGTDYNIPTQRSMELNLFEVKETVISRADGHTTISKTPKVTGKGQQYFINKFLS